jgi:tRNA-2-methylthio-N6-dimethylallyladenosine synthase
VRIKDHVSEETKTERIGRLIALVRGIAKRKNVGLIGTTHEVLVEGPAKRGALLQARTRTNKIALLDGPPEWIGSYRRVRFTGTTGSTFTAIPTIPPLRVAERGSGGEAPWS